jgi:hypothetical protein
MPLTLAPNPTALGWLRLLSFRIGRSSERIRFLRVRAAEIRRETPDSRIVGLLSRIDHHGELCSADKPFPCIADRDDEVARRSILKIATRGSEFGMEVGMRSRPSVGALTTGLTTDA